MFTYEPVHIINVTSGRSVNKFDRNMGFSPIVYICPEDVSIRNACFSTKVIQIVSAGEYLCHIVVPNFVTCLRWSYSWIPHGQGI